MKKYLLFSGSTYYACGGMHDLIGQSDSTKEIWEIISNIKEPSYKGSGWWHVYNTEKQKIIVCSKTQPHGAPDYEYLSEDKNIAFYELNGKKWVKVDKLKEEK